MSDFSCSVCSDTGRVSVPRSIFLLGSNREIMSEEWCECEIGMNRKEKEVKEKVVCDEALQKEKKINARIASNFGKIYENARMSDFPKNERMEELSRYIKDNTWIYLFGESRSGKTHLAAAIYREIGGTIVKSVNLDMIMSCYSIEGRGEKIENYAKTSILFIDDLGVGKLTHERHSIYYYIIDHRISNNLKTIFTSNYKTAKLWDGSVDIDPTRIITRIQETGKGFEIKNKTIL
jgi:DNA replication protein DnaC